MIEKLKCPKCGSSNIMQDDCYETIHGDDNTYKELIWGHCEDCEADLLWAETYKFKFIGYEAIEEGS